MNRHLMSRHLMGMHLIGRHLMGRYMGRHLIDAYYLMPGQALIGKWGFNVAMRERANS
jgi:hypothetical protein